MASELFYLAPDGMLMAVSVAARGSALDVERHEATVSAAVRRNAARGRPLRRLAETAVF